MGEAANPEAAGPSEQSLPRSSEQPPSGGSEQPPSGGSEQQPSGGSEQQRSRPRGERSRRLDRTGRLWLVLAANLALVVVLVAVGLGAHSLGVLAEGVDYLADAAGVAVALLAIWLARRPPSASRPQGFPRATRLAALANAGWLVLLCLLVAGQAVDRLVTGVPEVRGLPVLVASGVAAAVMVASALLLGGDLDDDLAERSAGGSGDDSGGGSGEDSDRGDEHEALSVRAVLLDTLADAAAAAGVAVSGAVILIAHGWYWLDPAVALLISVVIGYHAVRLLTRIRIALRE